MMRECRRSSQWILTCRKLSPVLCFHYSAARVPFHEVLEIISFDEISVSVYSKLAEHFWFQESSFLFYF